MVWSLVAVMCRLFYNLTPSISRAVYCVGCSAWLGCFIRRLSIQPTNVAHQVIQQIIDRLGILSSN